MEVEVKPKPKCARKAREWRLHRSGIDGTGAWGICGSEHETSCLCWYALEGYKRIRPIVVVREVQPRARRKK